MTRSEIYTKVRAQMRAYRRRTSARYDVSYWLLKMRGFGTRMLYAGNWSWKDECEYYFVQILGAAALCMEENGIVAPGVGPYMVKADDSALDLTLMAINKGCDRHLPGSSHDYAVRISYYLQLAFEVQTTSGSSGRALDYIRDMASLAVLGLTSEDQGEKNAEADEDESEKDQIAPSREQADSAGDC